MIKEQPFIVTSSNRHFFFNFQWTAIFWSANILAIMGESKNLHDKHEWYEQLEDK